MNETSTLWDSISTDTIRRCFVDILFRLLYRYYVFYGRPVNNEPLKLTLCITLTQYHY